MQGLREAVRWWYPQGQITGNNGLYRGQADVRPTSSKVWCVTQDYTARLGQHKAQAKIGQVQTCDNTDGHDLLGSQLRSNGDT